MFDGHFTDDTAPHSALIGLPADLVSLFFTIPEFHLGLDGHWFSDLQDILATILPNGFISLGCRGKVNCPSSQSWL